MNNNNIQQKQLERLQEMCEASGVDFQSIEELLDSVRTKKLFKKILYHQDAINVIVEKAIKNEI